METNRNVGTVKQYTRQSPRTVQEIIDKIASMSSYYRLNGNNCQDYAN